MEKSLSEIPQKRILFRKVCDDDRYYPDDFLEEYIPERTTELSLIEALPYCIEIVVQVTFVVIVNTMKMYIEHSSDNNSKIMSIILLLFLISALVIYLSSPIDQFDAASRGCKEFLLISIIQYSLSTVYLSFLRSHAEDSIGIWRGVTIGFYLISYPYKDIKESTKKESNKSYYTMILPQVTCIVLCSRLESHLQAFCLQTLTYVLFSVIEKSRNGLYQQGKIPYYISCFALVGFAGAFTLAVDPSAFIYYIVTYY